MVKFAPGRLVILASEAGQRDAVKPAPPPHNRHALAHVVGRCLQQLAAAAAAKEENAGKNASCTSKLPASQIRYQGMSGACDRWEEIPRRDPGMNSHTHIRTMALSDGELEDCYQAGVEAAQRAGKEASAAVVREKNVQTKSSMADLVTETDKKVEQLIFSFLRERFPHHKWGSVS